MENKKAYEKASRRDEFKHRIPSNSSIKNYIEEICPANSFTPKRIISDLLKFSEQAKQEFTFFIFSYSWLLYIALLDMDDVSLDAVELKVILFDENLLKFQINRLLSSDTILNSKLKLRIHIGLSCISSAFKHIYNSLTIKRTPDQNAYSHTFTSYQVKSSKFYDLKVENCPCLYCTTEDLFDCSSFETFESMLTPGLYFYYKMLNVNNSHYGRLLWTFFLNLSYLLHQDIIAVTRIFSESLLTLKTCFCSNNDIPQENSSYIISKIRLHFNPQELESLYNFINSYELILSIDNFLLSSVLNRLSSDCQLNTTKLSWDRHKLIFKNNSYKFENDLLAQKVQKLEAQEQLNSSQYLESSNTGKNTLSQILNNLNKHRTHESKMTTLSDLYLHLLPNIIFSKSFNYVNQELTSLNLLPLQTQIIPANDPSLACYWWLWSPFSILSKPHRLYMTNQLINKRYSLASSTAINIQNILEDYILRDTNDYTKNPKLNNSDPSHATSFDLFTIYLKSGLTLEARKHAWFCFDSNHDPLSQGFYALQRSQVEFKDGQLLEAFYQINIALNLFGNAIYNLENEEDEIAGAVLLVGIASLSFYQILTCDPFLAKNITCDPLQILSSIKTLIKKQIRVNQLEESNPFSQIRPFGDNRTLSHSLPNKELKKAAGHNTDSEQTNPLNSYLTEEINLDTLFSRFSCLPESSDSLGITDQFNNFENSPSHIYTLATSIANCLDNITQLCSKFLHKFARRYKNDQLGDNFSSSWFFKAIQHLAISLELKSHLNFISTNIDKNWVFFNSKLMTRFNKLKKLADFFCDPDDIGALWCLMFEFKEILNIQEFLPNSRLHEIAYKKLHFLHNPLQFWKLHTVNNFNAFNKLNLQLSIESEQDKLYNNRKLQSTQSNTATTSYLYDSIVHPQLSAYSSRDNLWLSLVSIAFTYPQLFLTHLFTHLDKLNFAYIPTTPISRSISLPRSCIPHKDACQFLIRRIDELMEIKASKSNHADESVRPYILELIELSHTLNHTSASLISIMQLSLLELRNKNFFFVLKTCSEIWKVLSSNKFPSSLVGEAHFLQGKAIIAACSYEFRHKSGGFDNFKNDKTLWHNSDFSASEVGSFFRGPRELRYPLSGEHKIYNPPTLEREENCNVGPTLLSGLSPKSYLARKFQIDHIEGYESIHKPRRTSSPIRKSHVSDFVETSTPPSALRKRKKSRGRQRSNTPERLISANPTHDSNFKTENSFFPNPETSKHLSKAKHHLHTSIKLWEEFGLFLGINGGVQQKQRIREALYILMTLSDTRFDSQKASEPTLHSSKLVKQFYYSKLMSLSSPFSQISQFSNSPTSTNRIGTY